MIAQYCGRKQSSSAFRRMTGAMGRRFGTARVLALGKGVAMAGEILMLLLGFRFLKAFH